MKLSIVIVNYNGRSILGECLRSVLDQTESIPCEVIVVDNASTDGSRELVHTDFPGVQLLESPVNRGFAAANNIGIRQSAGEYVLLLNPDTVVLSGALQNTVAFMDARPRAGVSGCKLRFPDGLLQRTAFSFPSVWNIFTEITFLYRLFPKTRLFGKYHLSYADYTKEFEADWLVGAFLMIRRSVIESVGLLDEQFFMYSEETDYCRRIKQAGYEVWFTPSGEVVHYWTGMNDLSRQTAIWVQRSQVLLYQKHFHGLSLALLIFLKYVGLALRIVVYGVSAAVTGNRYQWKKAKYTAVAIGKLVTSHWKYKPGYTGPIQPWDQEG